MKTLHRYSIVLLALLLGCSPLLRGGSSRQARLDRATDKVLSASSFRGASWSIMAVDLQDGRILISREEDRSLIPASNIKLLGTACALETLGPDYRIATTIGYSGRLESSGTLAGDLIIIGAGDPTMSSRFWDSTDTFSAWCDSLLRRNIRHIQGDLIGYIGLFKGDPLGSGWEWDDLPEWFAAEFSPLTYSDGCIEITVTPADSVGRPALINWG
ncbi:MAG TPA: D-alanyl-D-alanine carboxypeptidase, partial [bacterium]